MEPKKHQQIRDRAKAREIALGDMLDWYLQNSQGKLPEQLCEDKKAYKGKVLRWFEPPIPAITNPILVEEFIGDGWSLRFEPQKPRITNLRPS